MIASGVDVVVVAVTNGLPAVAVSATIIAVICYVLLLVLLLTASLLWAPSRLLSLLKESGLTFLGRG